MACGAEFAWDDIAPMLHGLGFSPTVTNVMAIVLIVLPLTAVTIVGGELLPKLFALRNMEFVCLRLSRLMKMFECSIWPNVWALDAGETWQDARGWRSHVTGQCHSTRARGPQAASAGSGRATPTTA